jgi:DNA helicase HerA-like ATPase
MSEIGKVISSSPAAIVIAINDLKIFEANKSNLQIGRYLKIAQGNNDYTIAIIKNLHSNNQEDQSGNLNWTFLIECQAVGTLVADKNFERGSMLLPVPTEPAYIADKDTLDKLFLTSDEFNFPLGSLSLNKDVHLKINGDKFFSKHIAIVGSTGSGKSYTVAKILQDVVGIENDKNLKKSKQNNSHVVIFDLHSEYAAAFSLHKDELFSLNILNVDELKLPYWLMNSEELESLFIESNEQNSHNQVSIFKQAVILNKEKHNPTIKNMTYDTPVYFSIKEVYNYIENMNREVIGRLQNENKPKLLDNSLVEDRKCYFDQIYDFATPSTAKADKATNGPFNGEFNRFVSRLETKLADKRLKFLLDPVKKDSTPYKSEDFEEIVKQFIGYLNKSNITIVDISGVPFEVLSITISLVSRIVFDFCFHYTKLRHGTNQLNDVPVMIVCEEAHNYVPQSENAAYRASRKSIERIAKEGRKYGLGLTIVSQRPSEVSETIFAQCNNFIALRLTNSNDQNYVKRLFPDNSNAIADILPNLAPGEAVVVGDAVLLPSVIKMTKPKPEPRSQSVAFHKEWQVDWRDITFKDVIKRWIKE